MKKIMLVVLMLAAVGCGVSVAGSVAVVRTGDIFKVIYESNDITNVSVMISDGNGEKIFSEELISIHGFIRPYNFSNLPKGDYTVNVTDHEGNNSRKVSFQNQVWAAHIGNVSYDNQKVMVAIPQGKNDFTLQVLDQNEHVLYSEDRKTEEGYARVINLKKVEPGATVRLVNHLTGETKSFVVE